MPFEGSDGIPCSLKRVRQWADRGFHRDEIEQAWIEACINNGIPLFTWVVPGLVLHAIAWWKGLEAFDSEDKVQEDKVRRGGAHPKDKADTDPQQKEAMV